MVRLSERFLDSHRKELRTQYRIYCGRKRENSPLCDLGEESYVDLVKRYVADVEQYKTSAQETFSSFCSVMDTEELVSRLDLTSVSRSRIVFDMIKLMEEQTRSEAALLSSVGPEIVQRVFKEARFCASTIDAVTGTVYNAAKFGGYIGMIAAEKTFGGAETDIGAAISIVILFTDLVLEVWSVTYISSQIDITILDELKPLCDDLSAVTDTIVRLKNMFTTFLRTYVEIHDDPFYLDKHYEEDFNTKTLREVVTAYRKKKDTMGLLYVLQKTVKRLVDSSVDNMRDIGCDELYYVQQTLFKMELSSGLLEDKNPMWTFSPSVTRDFKNWKENSLQSQNTPLETEKRQESSLLSKAKSPEKHEKEVVSRSGMGSQSIQSESEKSPETLRAKSEDTEDEYSEGGLFAKMDKDEESPKRSKEEIPVLKKQTPTCHVDVIVYGTALILKQELAPFNSMGIGDIMEKVFVEFASLYNIHSSFIGISVERMKGVFGKTIKHRGDIVERDLSNSYWSTPVGQPRGELEYVTFFQFMNFCIDRNVKLMESVSVFEGYLRIRVMCVGWYIEQLTAPSVHPKLVPSVLSCKHALSTAEYFMSLKREILLGKLLWVGHTFFGVARGFRKQVPSIGLPHLSSFTVAASDTFNRRSRFCPEIAKQVTREVCAHVCEQYQYYEEDFTFCFQLQKISKADIMAKCVDFLIASLRSLRLPPAAGIVRSMRRDICVYHEKENNPLVSWPMKKLSDLYETCEALCDETDDLPDSSLFCAKLLLKFNKALQVKSLETTCLHFLRSVSLSEAKELEELVEIFGETKLSSTRTRAILRYALFGDLNVEDYSIDDFYELCFKRDAEEKEKLGESLLSRSQAKVMLSCIERVSLVNPTKLTQVHYSANEQRLKYCTDTISQGWLHVLLRWPTFEACFNSYLLLSHNPHHSFFCHHYCLSTALVSWSYAHSITGFSICQFFCFRSVIKRDTVDDVKDFTELKVSINKRMRVCETFFSALDQSTCAMVADKAFGSDELFCKSQCGTLVPKHWLWGKDSKETENCVLSCMNQLQWEHYVLVKDSFFTKIRSNVELQNLIAQKLKAN